MLIGLVSPRNRWISGTIRNKDQSRCFLGKPLLLPAQSVLIPIVDRVLFSRASLKQDIIMKSHKRQQVEECHWKLF